MTGFHAPPATPDPRSSLSLLGDRTFGPWFWGMLASNSGNWLFNVTAAVVVFRLTQSAFMVGLVSVAQYVPLVLFSPLAGAWSDRVDRRRLLFGSQFAAAGCATALAITTYRAGVDGLTGAWPVILTALGIGFSQAMAAPALNSIVPFLVDDQDLESGVALTSLTYNVGRALGPAGAGILLATLGPTTAFIVNAVSFLPLLGALVIVQPRRVERRDDADRSALAGLRFVRRRRDMLLLLVGIGTIGSAADPTITLTPALADELGRGDGLVALLVSAFGAAAAVASVASGRLQRAVGNLGIAGAGALLLAGSLTLAGAAPSATIAIAAFSGAGAGFVLAVNGFTTSLQRRAPDELRGRVMALWGVAFLGNRPIAAALDGAAADRFGPRLAMGLAISLALASFVVAMRLRGQEAATLRAR